MDDTKTANAPQQLSSRIYARSYAGLEIDPDRNISDDAVVLWRIIKLVFKNRIRISFAIIGIVAAACSQLMIPQFLGDAVDGALGLAGQSNVSPDIAREALYSAAIFLLGAAALRGLFTLLHSYCGESLGHLIAFDLRIAFYAKLQQLSFSFHDHVHTGELITRGMLDLEGVRSFMNTGLLRVLLLLILIGVGAYLLISTDLILGLLALSFLPFVIWKSSVSQLRLRELWWTLQEKMAVLGRIMDENLTGIRVVRAFGAESFELEKYGVGSDEAYDLAAERIKIRVASTTAMTFVYFLAMGLVLWVGGLRVIDGQMTVGTLTEFLAFMTILQLPVRQLGNVVNAFARTLTCASRIFGILDLQPVVADKPGAVGLGDGIDKIKFENVVFAYPGEGQPAVLNDISFDVSLGKTLGVVGPPGSGKSTIAHLLPRFYDVTSGRISINDIDIRDVEISALRQKVVVLAQDPFLFTSSLENNIAYGNPWASEENIYDAAKVSQLDGFIDGLPDQYETLVGERGVSLSGGQKQRVVIARTTMLQPELLILDDSTAAIDAGTEQRIRQALKMQASKSATIIISHRLGTLRHADEILFIENGQIVERGSHETLVEAGGKYAALFALQSKEGEEAVAQIGGVKE
ncbi:MAG: multidrug ABC transporter [Rhodospirillaceae bacterium]|nr:multidrug ABC transporter [Rhodospirillaceae bacterium]|tara:strand:+ start:54013 stop:55914 length:1902 start_codon:yes stop_codon:yes gene_type:complete